MLHRKSKLRSRPLSSSVYKKKRNVLSTTNHNISSHHRSLLHLVSHAHLDKRAFSRPSFLGHPDRCPITRSVSHCSTIKSDPSHCRYRPFPNCTLIVFVLAKKRSSLMGRFFIIHPSIDGRADEEKESAGW